MEKQDQASRKITRSIVEDSWEGGYEMNDQDRASIKIPRSMLGNWCTKKSGQRWLWQRLMRRWTKMEEYLTKWKNK